MLYGKEDQAKKNDYLDEFDFDYVINNLNDYIIGKGVE